MLKTYHLIYIEEKRIGFSDFEREDEKEYQLYDINGTIEIKEGNESTRVEIKSSKYLLKYPLLDKPYEMEVRMSIQHEPYEMREKRDQNYGFGGTTSIKTVEHEYMNRYQIVDMRIRDCKPSDNQSGFGFGCTPSELWLPENKKEEILRPYILKFGNLETKYFLTDNVIGELRDLPKVGFMGPVLGGFMKNVQYIHITFKVIE